MKNKPFFYLMALTGMLSAILISCKPEPVDTTVTDIDGNVYHTIIIGTQTWMLENLKTTHYRNGDPIPNGSIDSVWVHLTAQGYANYNTTTPDMDIYGKLYNWYAVNDERNLCPEGWHVPSNAEWNTLANYLGGNSVAGGKLKETGNANWASPNVATNEIGFNGLPGGGRFDNSNFFGLGGMGIWWTSSELQPSNVYVRTINNFGSELQTTVFQKRSGFSVRCIKD